MFTYNLLRISLLAVIIYYDFTPMNYTDPYTQVNNDLTYKWMMEDVFAQYIIGLDIECDDKNSYLGNFTQASLAL